MGSQCIGTNLVVVILAVVGLVCLGVLSVVIGGKDGWLK